MNIPTHLYVPLILLFFIQCQYKTDKHRTGAWELNKENLKSQKAKNLAVDDSQHILYRSLDLGESWQGFSTNLPEDATLSGIKQTPDQLYITTDYHGVFRYNHNLKRWSSINENLPKSLDINCIESQSNRLVIGTLNNGIYLSDTDDLNWTTPKKNIQSPIRALLHRNKSLYAGTDHGIYQSVDAGQTWNHVYGKMQILGFTELNDKIYAATQSGALISGDDPYSWKIIYSGDALHDIANDGIHVYAMTLNSQLLKSQDEGQNWITSQEGIHYPVNFYTNEIIQISDYTFSAQWIGIYRSLNQGTNWERLSGLPDSTAFSTLASTQHGILAGISIR